ncbi:extracellular solute-binding protein [Herbiconiux moechotypicola]|uniref:ABC transporter substrate-binding protein n=1 Tax=Herbiconiux moechotypicola TaxID=637393 RepID=UPI00217CED3E|nr:extracellular solute-binding protein [Herbiconiux moechotypicola]MCS5732004.1 extracellular solute-binding protein [Herbiconiux moechotypicola]
MITLGVVGGLVAGLVACSGSGGDSGGKVELEFLQSKPEAVATVDALIAEFEATHPDITVKQNSSPDALTVLQSRIAKDKAPDVVALNVSVYRNLIDSQILTDLSGTAAAESVTDDAATAYMHMSGQTDETLALPWSVNAQVVLYNKGIYDQLGLEVPTTWSEMISNAEAIKAAGQNPFFFTWKDAWTAKTVFNSVAGSLQPADFLTELQGGDSTFADSSFYSEAAEKLLELKQYGQTDPFGKGYDDGNAAFANGEAAMYVQGIWAIPPILASNPDINLGAFVMPVTDDPSQTKILSGVDSLIGITTQSQHPEEAQEFLDFLLEQEPQATFTNDQHLFSVRSDVSSDDPVLAPLKAEWIDTGKVATYPDAMFTGSSDLSGVVQVFLQDGDVDAFLAALDQDWQANGLRP